MRHRIKKNSLKMQNDHSNLLIRGLVTDLFLHGKLKTTLKKAEITAMQAEKLITYVKTHDKLLAIRKMKSYLLNELASKNLMDKIVPSLETKTSGYTRVLKAGYRAGDSAPMCYVELT